MTNYILLHNGVETHYFYKPYEGLCMRQKKNTMWQDYQVLYRQALDQFGVYMDEHQNVHIICANTSAEIIYFLYKNQVWHKYTLTTLKENMQPGKIKIAHAGGRLQFLYSAMHENVHLLIHCVLGNNAKPTPIDKIRGDDFFISGNRVYYANASQTLGYQDLTDGKPDRFIPICENASMPYLLPTGRGNLVTYIKDHMIYFQNKPVYTDKYAKNPILLPNENRLLLLWQEGDFVRYLTSLNNGATWSTPMQFVNPGKSAELFHVQKGENIYHYYGNHSGNTLNIFGTNTLFDARDLQPDHASKKIEEPRDIVELTKIKIMIDITRSEIVELKRELKMLKQETEHIKAKLSEIGT